jgi:hypothetical protein
MCSESDFDTGTDPLVPGQPLLMRNFRGSELIALEVGRYVGDHFWNGEHGPLVWIGLGAATVLRTAADGSSIGGMSPARLAATRTVLTPGTWAPGNTLVLTPPGASYAVHWWFTPAGDFAGWYVNLQRPAVCWSSGGTAGIDTVDQTLDVLVAPDRSWRWKDEESFRERTGHHPFFSAAEAEQIRAEGLRVAALAESGAFPFDGTLADFRPEPGWATHPALPAGWDQPQFQ